MTLPDAPFPMLLLFFLLFLLLFLLLARRLLTILGLVPARLHVSAARVGELARFIVFEEKRYFS